MHDLMHGQFGEQRRKELLREAKTARRARGAAEDRKGGAGRRLKRLYGRLRGNSGAEKGPSSKAGQP